MSLFSDFPDLISAVFWQGGQGRGAARLGVGPEAYLLCQHTNISVSSEMRDAEVLNGEGDASLVLDYDMSPCRADWDGVEWGYATLCQAWVWLGGDGGHRSSVQPLPWVPSAL